MNRPQTYRFFRTDSIGTVLRLLPVFLTGLLPACSGEPPALTIGDVAFSETDLLGFTPTRRTRLAEITAFGLAVARGEESLLGDPLVARRTQVLLLEALEREVALDLAGVDEATLQARYGANPDYELTVRHLVVLVDQWDSPQEEEEAREKAQDALDRIRAGEDFAQVAGKVSEEPGAAERGGLLQPGRRDTWVAPFWDAAVSLKVGEVSSVVRTPYGFHVLKLEGRTPLPFADARFHLVQEVARELPDQGDRIESWTDSVAHSMTLVVDSSALSSAWEEAGSLFVLADKTLRNEDPQAPVARWDGGVFTRADLAAFLLDLQRPSWEYLREQGLPDLYRIAGEAARRALLAGVARAKGVTLPEAMKDSFRREWETTVAGWAGGLGFETGMGPDAVRAAALAAMASSAQGVTIVRQEIQSWAPLLLSTYPIGPETPTGSGS